MKKIIILIIIAFCNLIIINAQDVINPPKFSYFSSTVGRYDTLIYRSARPYVLGYNWGSQGARLDEALGINYYHDGYDTIFYQISELITR
ncbi:MAG: hypothetical protein A2X64_04115 [Ignavibacteria bacterium GWF2_33_9]|nr:MAG: hypothetical protein A2X64_04115 [Ignavibacteria bacterium GWF2_33_9]